MTRLWSGAIKRSYARDRSLIFVSSFTPQGIFDTIHNFTWISVDESLAFRRQHSISAWYPFDKYITSTTLEVFNASDVDSAALAIHFLHMYGGLSGYNVRVDGIKHVKTSRTDLALYVIFSIRVSAPPSHSCTSISS